MGDALRNLLGRLTGHRVVSWDSGYAPEALEADEEGVIDLTKADVISSVHRDNPIRHAVILDIDYPAHLVPSTSGDHYHLYLDVPGGVEHDAYMRLVKALGDAGVIEEGYAGASIRRGYTSLRPPWASKGRPILRCTGCQRRAEDIPEYQEYAKREGIDVADWVWTNEGTLDRKTGALACTDCYIKMGQPSSPVGWTASQPVPAPVSTDPF